MIVLNQHQHSLHSVSFSTDAIYFFSDQLEKGRSIIEKLLVELYMYVCLPGITTLILFGGFLKKSTSTLNQNTQFINQLKNQPVPWIKILNLLLYPLALFSWSS